MTTATRFINVTEFNSNTVKLHGMSSSGLVQPAASANIDLTLGFQACLTGAQLIVKSASIDDVISLQVAHPQAGVLSEFISEWHMSEDVERQFMLDIPFPANLPAGLIIRAVYTASSEGVARNVRLNWHLYEVISGPLHNPNSGKNDDPVGEPPEDLSIEVPPSIEDPPGE